MYSTIPFTSDELSSDYKLTVKMSDICFNDTIKDKTSVLLYIRNTGLLPDLVFDDCDYLDKEEYLLLFLTKDIAITSDVLALAWLDILFLNSHHVSKDSILNEDEISFFRERNMEFINSILSFAHALPLYAIYTFHTKLEDPIDIGDIPSKELPGLKITNFYQITSIEQFVLLIDDESKLVYPPVFYRDKFAEKYNEYNMHLIMRDLPYINILQIMLSPKEAQDEVLEELNKFFNNQIEGNDSIE